MKKRSYVHYLSVLKCVGMLAVIGIHVFCTPVSRWRGSFSAAGLWAGVFLTDVLRAWAVPVFVMVSGALFLGREVSVGKMFGKYILRLVLVLLTFGTLYALMEIIFAERSFSVGMLAVALRNVYAGALWDHMWFVYMCIGLYVVTPPLQRLVRALDDAMLRYLLVVLFVFTCLIPQIDSMTGVTFGVYLPVRGIWLFYYLLGYALHTGRVKIGAMAGILFVLVGVIWCAIAASIPSLWNIADDGGIGLKYIGTSSVLAVLMATGIFSLARAKCTKTADWVDTVANPLSFGVYILHAVFVNFMYKVVGFTPERHSVWVMYAVVLAVTVCGSLTLAWLLRLIPPVRKYLL